MRLLYRWGSKKVKDGMFLSFLLKEGAKAGVCEISNALLCTEGGLISPCLPPLPEIYISGGVLPWNVLGEPLRLWHLNPHVPRAVDGWWGSGEGRIDPWHLCLAWPIAGTPYVFIELIWFRARKFILFCLVSPRFLIGDISCPGYFMG